MVPRLMNAETTPTAPPPVQPPITFTLESQPTWGIGLVVSEVHPYLTLFFEHAGEKKFVKDKVKGLTPAPLAPDALEALKARAAGRKPKAPPKPSASLRPAVRKPAEKKVAAPRFASIQAQVAVFEQLFPGGFQGEAFTKDERGVPGATGKLGYKEAAITLAKQALSAEAFASTPPEELFKNAVAVLAGTNIAFPMTDVIPFRQLEGDDRAKALAGLKELLHGSGPYGERLERFTGSLNIKEAGGEARKVTWPLATIFGGLFDPAQHVCVKPTAFAAQALMLGVAVEKTQPVNAAGYALFLEVAQKTKAALIEAGHQPRDLVDVYSFIYTTHASKPAA